LIKREGRGQKPKEKEKRKEQRAGIRGKVAFAWIKKKRFV